MSFGIFNNKIHDFVQLNSQWPRKDQKIFYIQTEDDTRQLDALS